MAAMVWFTIGIAIWHFTVFVPDRFWGGIVGAFLGAIAGSMLTGGIAHIAASRGIGDTDIGTALIAVPGAIVGMAAIYLIGLRTERPGLAD
jgi:Ca2+/Na+ antiporter